MICRKPRLSNRQKYRHRWGCYFFDKDRRCMCTYGDAVFPSSRFFQRRFSWDGGRAEDRLRISPDFSHISRYSARVRSRGSIFETYRSTAVPRYQEFERNRSAKRNCNRFKPSRSVTVGHQPVDEKGEVENKSCS